MGDPILEHCGRPRYNALRFANEIIRSDRERIARPNCQIPFALLGLAVRKSEVLRQRPDVALPFAVHFSDITAGNAAVGP